MSFNIAFIRRDLIDSNTTVSIGDYNEFTVNPFCYRWQTEERFQVFVNERNKWMDAESIDFEFPTVKEFGYLLVSLININHIDALTTFFNRLNRPMKVAMLGHIEKQLPDIDKNIIARLNHHL